ncbi:cytochrome c oxidase assembly protein [Bacillus sp. PS06]|uniref:cytochrome c oxidase assembly protein n=1 Tax=Bacillus sp. PS06 TaxID=2764176 RepID=UPI0017806467|nr:cytochrome c oxidase assembly protein [Bacillus sp. PS06]MBD8068702.1 cytochrome c oxidase assembly protein [Bacillus sp. PS06]
MHNEHSSHIFGLEHTLLLVILFSLLIAVYVISVFLSNRHYKRWPTYRLFSWGLGVLCISAIFIGPIADRSHVDFTFHMLGHVLLGMVAPFLIVLSAPMTLLMRSLNVRAARQLSKLLKSFPLRILINPLVAAVINMGGLWILYTTELYAAMHQRLFLYLFIHIHVFIAGYLYIASMIYIDPTPHRTPFLTRAIILVLASTSHGILSKYIYANPPIGVTAQQAESGAMLMYYGGDIVDIFLISILCFHWYKASKARAVMKKEINLS